MLPLVSCICPTYNRHERHENAYRYFANQRYPNKELLILDDSKTLSPFFVRLRDPRVRYWHSKERRSIGRKRNNLISRARGCIIMHQDDDDRYGPNYLVSMTRRLRGSDLVKLSVFNIINERNKSRWRWDTRTSGGPQSLISSKYSGLCISIPFGWANTDVATWGFGFSYVYLKSLWDKVKFPDISLREDYEFIKRAREGGAKLKQVSDCYDQVWHSVHGESTSTTFPQVRLDGPTPIPIVNILTGSALGMALGTIVGGPIGAVAGGGLGTALTGLFVRRHIS
jgi:glycosyltransferase involved in cell wall biosynthesis